MQEIYGLSPCLRDACNATDLSDLFQPGAVPAAASSVPEPSTWSAMLIGAVMIGFGSLRRRRR